MRRWSVVIVVTHRCLLCRRKCLRDVIARSRRRRHCSIEKTETEQQTAITLFPVFDRDFRLPATHQWSIESSLRYVFTLSYIHTLCMRMYVAHRHVGQTVWCLINSASTMTVQCGKHWKKCHYRIYIVPTRYNLNLTHRHTIWNNVSNIVFSNLRRDADLCNS